MTAIHVGERLALRDDDVLGDIRYFIDLDGDECDPFADGASAIVEWRDGGWTSLPLSDFAFDRRVVN